MSLTKLLLEKLRILIACSKPTGRNILGKSLIIPQNVFLHQNCTEISMHKIDIEK